MKLMPTPKQPTKKKPNILLKLIIVIIIGLLVGYFGPLKIFRKKIVNKNSH